MKDKTFKLVMLLFAFLIVIMTYPLVFRITTHIPGFFSTDESYSVLWNAWFLKFSLAHKLSITKTNLIAYPFGMNTSPLAYIFFAVNYILAILTTPVLTYNLQILMNLFLVAVFNYLLVYFLTNNRLCGIFSGIIFAFCPYIFVRAWQHLGETYLWMMPMVLLGVFILRENPSKKIKTFCVLGLVLTTLNFNVVHYMIVALTTFIAYLLFSYLAHRKRRKKNISNKDRKHLKNVFIVSLLALLVVVPQFYPIVKGTVLSKGTTPSAFNSYRRPFDDLFTQSAKPLSYVLPAAMHPVFGNFTKWFIGSPLYGVSYTEHTLYLGWIPLIFAFIAWKKWRKRKKAKAKKQETISTGNENFYIGFFVLLAIVAWLFSQPPYFTFPYFKIYMPSFFMYKLLPMFRAYCRFGVVVMLAVSILAGFGLKFFLGKFRRTTTKIIVTGLLSGLVLFEFWNYPPFKVIDVTKYHTVYNWLKSQEGDFVVAEYPLDVDSPNEYYKLRQIIHEKKIINATLPGSPANKIAKTIWKLSAPKTAGILRWMKVKYVLVHLGSYEKSNDMEIVNELRKVKTKRLPGLRLIKSFDDVDVYEVRAKAIEPIKND
ncbi:MAG: hypothetical protein HQ547_05135 [Candidatus Omnitrophica bacterium]|nr:hypothetical protein [Candidatus Omnitrophota bacterium]